MCAPVKKRCAPNHNLGALWKVNYSVKLYSTCSWCMTTKHMKKFYTVFFLPQLPRLHCIIIVTSELKKKWAWNYVVKFMWGCYSFWTSFYTIWCKYTWNKSSPYIWLLHENMHSVLVIIRYDDAPVFNEMWVMWCAKRKSISLAKYKIIVIKIKKNWKTEDCTCT